LEEIDVMSHPRAGYVQYRIVVLSLLVLTVVAIATWGCWPAARPAPQPDQSSQPVAPAPPKLDPNVTAAPATGHQPPQSPTSAQAPAPQPRSPAAPTRDQDVREIAANARELQRAGKFQEADAKWAQVENEIERRGRPDELSSLRQEAAGNRKELKPLLDKATMLTDTVKRAKSEIPVPDRPKKIDRTEIIKYYPAGRTIRSGGEFIIMGRGSSRDWVFKNNAYFVVDVLAAVDTKVRANDGDAVQFEVAFKEVSRTLLESNSSLELTEPDSPLLETFWQPLEEQVLLPLPAYRVLKSIAEMANVVDPHLKRTLTWLQERLRRNGVPVGANDPIEMMSGIDRLSGTRVELSYVNGFGVTRVKILNGIKLPEEDLESLRKSSGPLLDYFIFDGGKRKVGASWDVRPQDVANLVRLNYRYDTTGEIKVKRGPDGPDGLAVLNVVGGNISCTSRGEDANEEVKLGVEPGSFVKYSQNELLATKANIRFRLESRYQSLDHFLFGASDVRDVNIEARYEAHREDKP